MPSTEDIKRIHAEEMLRREIREEIEAAKEQESGKKSAGSGLSEKLMDFLNSSVGMWLLSSVVLTSGAAMIQQFQHQYQIREQNHKQLVQHLFEIQNRLDNMETRLTARAQESDNTTAAYVGHLEQKLVGRSEPHR